MNEFPERDRLDMFDGGENAAEMAENARLKVLYHEGKCFCNPCGDDAIYQLTDADNNNRPFLLCESHYKKLHEG